MNIPPQAPNATRGLRLGLTGGMGGGKSTAAGIFTELGFAVLDSDRIVRELWHVDEAVKAAALARWGVGILDMANESRPVINRRKVAEIVFTDVKELEWVEGLLHPRVGERWRAALAAEPARDWVVEIPLLFEKNLASDFDFTLCLWTSPALQAVRLAARGLSPVEIAARQARQWPLREKAERADLVVLNDGSLDFLRQQIVNLASQLRRSTQ